MVTNVHGNISKPLVLSNELDMIKDPAGEIMRLVQRRTRLNSLLTVPSR